MKLGRRMYFYDSEKYPSSQTLYLRKCQEGGLRENVIEFYFIRDARHPFFKKVFPLKIHSLLILILINNFTLNVVFPKSTLLFII